jgi:GNAT superfamily N-acetyltransferase
VSRNPVQVRDAEPADAGALLRVWGDFRRSSADRLPGRDPEEEAASSVARISADPDERLLVGLIDGEVVGAAHLLRARISPIHTETAIHVTHLHVLGGHRRHGVGKALVEAAVSWAEEKDTSRLLAAASSHSRDANRFMARLGLTQFAVVRGASIGTLRAKLPVEPPAGAMATTRNHRSVGQVLAQRRLQRRAQSDVR